MLLVALVLYVVAAFLWPIVRVWRRTGIWPVAFAREAAPMQRVFGVMTGALLFVVVGGAALASRLGPEALGVVGLPGVAATVGWGLFAAGAALTVVAQWQMGSSWRMGIDARPTELVTRGVFAAVRNPIFTGLLMVLTAYALLLPAWWSVAVLALAAVALRGQIGFEERHLTALHGERYLAYASRVGRLVPGLGRLAAPVVSSTFVPGVHGRDIIGFLLRCDDASYQRWWPGTHLRMHTEVRRPGDVGNVVYMDELVGARRLRARGVITALEPERRIEWSLRPLGLTLLRLVVETRDADGGTQLTHTIDAVPALWRWWLSGSFRDDMHRHCEEEFRRLGELLRG